jgi:hypothetical protein
MLDKDAAFIFLRALEDHLNNSLPEPSVVSRKISDLVRESQASRSDRHLAHPESAFLNYFIVKVIHEFLSVQQRLGDEDARKALLSESYRHFRKFTSGTPAGSQGHPFTKVIGMKPRAIIEQWKSSEPGYSNCPDMALRSPCPHKVVIEGKYFPKGGLQAAETTLVTGIYQAFFYRSLPTVPETSKHAAWDYNYACLLAYDATEQAALLKAWNSLNKKVRKSCWEGAHVYVMILRGGG